MPSMRSGQRAFGENYVQEGAAKRAALGRSRRPRMAPDRAVAGQQGTASRPRPSPGCRRSTGRRSPSASAARATRPADRRSTCWSRSTRAAKPTKSGVAPPAGRRPRACRRGAAGLIRLRGIMGIAGATARLRPARTQFAALARLLRRLPGRGLARRHAVDGHVGGSRIGDRRGRDPGARSAPRSSARGIRTANDHLHRRRQHGDRADRRPDRRGRGSALGFSVVEPLPAQRERLAARFPGVALHAGFEARCDRPARASWCSPSSRSRCARPRTRWRASPRRCRCRGHHRRRHPPRRPRALAGRGRAARARDAQYARADRRGHQRGLRDARPTRRMRASSRPSVLGAGGQICGALARMHARPGDRLLRQRPRLRVLFPRSARARRRSTWAFDAADGAAGLPMRRDGWHPGAGGACAEQAT